MLLFMLGAAPSRSKGKPAHAWTMSEHWLHGFLLEVSTPKSALPHNEMQAVPPVYCSSLEQKEENFGCQEGSLSTSSKSSRSGSPRHSATAL